MIQQYGMRIVHVRLKLACMIMVDFIVNRFKIKYTIIEIEDVFGVIHKISLSLKTKVQV